MTEILSNLRGKITKQQAKDLDFMITKYGKQEYERGVKEEMREIQRIRND